MAPSPVVSEGSVERTVNRASLRAMGIAPTGAVGSGAPPGYPPGGQASASMSGPTSSAEPPRPSWEAVGSSGAGWGPQASALPDLSPGQSTMPSFTTPPLGDGPSRQGSYVTAQRLLFVVAVLSVVSFVVNLMMDPESISSAWTGLVGGALTVAAGLQVVKPRPTAATAWMVLLFIGAAVNAVTFLLSVIGLVAVAKWLGASPYLFVSLYAMVVLAFNCFAFIKGALAFKGRAT